AEAARAIKEVAHLNRDHVRAEFERRFTAQHMARNYLKLYSRLAHLRAPVPALYGAAHLPRSVLAAHAAANTVAPGLNAGGRGPSAAAGA
ncbi:MAG TPA: hypothetical protein VGD54_19610, partial [Steroidobacteraceae bacterium]